MGHEMTSKLLKLECTRATTLFSLFLSMSAVFYDKNVFFKVKIRLSMIITAVI